MTTTTTTTTTENQRQHLDAAVQQAGDLAALLQAINETMPNPLVQLAAELAHRLDDEIEAAVLAG